MRCLLLAVSLVAVIATAARAEPAEDAGDDGEVLYSCGKAAGKVSVSFKPEVELKELVSWAMGFTCRNFVVGVGVGGRSSKVTIIAPKQLTPRQAWRTFLVALQSMNLTVVDKGPVLEIVEAPQAKDHALGLRGGGWPEGSERVARMIVRPEHIDVGAAARALEALKSKIGVVTALEEAGVLVVTDYGSAIATMRHMLGEIDRPGPAENIYSIPVEYVDVVDLVAKLETLLGAGASQRAAPAPRRPTRRGRRGADTPRAAEGSAEAAPIYVPTRMVADERSNSILLVGTEEAYGRVVEVVDRIDVEMPGADAGRIHIYELQNADAEKLSQTLTMLATGAAASQPQRKGAAPRQGQGKAPEPPLPSGAVSLEGDVTVSFDVETNALLVVASLRDYLALRPIIRRLDAGRTQVYIEAVVMEVSTDHARKLGFSFHGSKDTENGVVVGGFQSDLGAEGAIKSTLPGSALTGSGLIGGFLGPALQGLSEFLPNGVTIPSFGALFVATAGESDTDVLSAPHIMTANNVTATISAGENIPYASGGFGTPTADGSSLVSQTTYQRRDLDLKLAVTPHVNRDGLVRLDIELETSDLGTANFANTGQPTWTTRTMTTTIMVHDQETIVLGGLVSEKLRVVRDKIPFLGDIPVLGRLFRSSSTTKEKRNLLVVLTPHIVSDRIGAHDILQRRMRERHEFLGALDRFRHSRYQPDVDYRRKRGLIEEINRTVHRYEQRAAELESLQRERFTLPQGRIGGDGPREE